MTLQLYLDRPLLAAQERLVVPGPIMIVLVAVTFGCLSAPGSSRPRASRPTGTSRSMEGHVVMDMNIAVGGPFSGGSQP